MILSGVVGIIVLLFVEVEMEDGFIYVINNFIWYGGLVGFILSDFVVVKIYLFFGVVIFVVDSSSCVIIIVRFVGNLSVMKDFEVYCNLELIVGEIDVGVKEGVVILLLGEGDVWKMLIRINFGIVGILVVYVEI